MFCCAVVVLVYVRVLVARKLVGPDALREKKIVFIVDPERVCTKEFQKESLQCDKTHLFVIRVAVQNFLY